MNRVLYFVPVIVLALVGIVFYRGLTDGSGDEIASVLIGQPMPELPETTIEGYEAGDIEQILAENDLVLVNVFASWCGPCRAEHPSLVELGNQGIAIIGLNYKDDPDNAIEFLEELGNPYVGVRTDESGRSAIDWGISGVPETFFVNSEGVILKRQFGPITQRVLESEILPFIEENS